MCACVCMCLRACARSFTQLHSTLVRQSSEVCSLAHFARLFRKQLTEVSKCITSQTVVIDD